MIFKDFWILFFIPVVVFLILFLKNKQDTASLKFSNIGLAQKLKPTLKVLAVNKLFYLRIAALVLFMIALARPQELLDQVHIETEGIDIILAIDASGSMLAEDFMINQKRYNRLEVVRGVVKDFIEKRDSDRIGIVAFAGRAYTVCPLTLDYDWLIKNLERIEIGAIEDGTAIGSAISSSLNRLKDTKAKSKIIVLLTDGVNNAGKISPLNAASAAEALNVKIYTIGAGTKGLVPYPAKNLFGQTVYQKVKIDIDEDVLSKIAQDTGGTYFRATDTKSLKEIYEEIDAMEKTTAQVSGYREYKELFYRFLLMAMFIFVLEVILANTILRKLP